jgi:hypothetical protein
MDATFWNDRYAVAGHVYGEELLMTLASLREELSGLAFGIARELERDVTEGTGHTGRGAVVQVLARRPPTAKNLFSSNSLGRQTS